MSIPPVILSEGSYHRYTVLGTAKKNNLTENELKCTIYVESLYVCYINKTNKYGCLLGSEKEIIKNYVLPKPTTDKSIHYSTCIINWVAHFSKFAEHGCFSIYTRKIGLLRDSSQARLLNTDNHNFFVQRLGKMSVPY